MEMVANICRKRIVGQFYYIVAGLFSFCPLQEPSNDCFPGYVHSCLIHVLCKLAQIGKN